MAVSTYMSAINLIHINFKCPNCGNIAAIECQTHVASSFDGPDATRLCNVSYNVGDTMNWFDKQHPKYLEWKQGNHKIALPDKTEMECCYSCCSICRNECFAVIHFRDCKILNVEPIGKIEDWPENFHK